MQKANVTGNNGLFMCVRLVKGSSYSAARVLHTENLGPIVGHEQLNSTWTENPKPCYRLCLAGDNEVQAKEAA